MRVTRRNVLVLLGVLTVAGGVAFGTGAFTQVQADRTVTANVADDANAYLQLDGDGDYVTDSGNGEIEFTFDRLNDNATSTFEGVLNVTADPADDAGTYDVSVQSGTGLGSSAVMDVQDSSDSSIVGSSVSVSAGTTEQLTIVFDTNNGDISNAPDSITIVANEQ